MAQAFEWGALLRAGIRGAGLKPHEFWRLTPAELMLILGVDGQGRAFSRGRLDALLAQYPDEAVKGESDGGI
ncbi:rcc01693 family protein [Thalassobius sp. I31.1]|uniref:rcc01693 family protein n=1 Tax=Thalassobius sp. I31.1 TaxID=2109912 RepID=UPI000D1BA891|nr:rcc01693 family protein [Thalassobius sp. I31.1]